MLKIRINRNFVPFFLQIDEHLRLLLKLHIARKSNRPRPCSLVIETLARCKFDSPIMSCYNEITILRKNEFKKLMTSD